MTVSAATSPCTPLERALTTRRLSERARPSRPQIFDRGKDYWRSGQATVTEVTETELCGEVQGSALYQVRLAVSDPRAELEVSCGCPYSENGKCCKHAVALGLAWLASRGLWPPPFPPPLEPDEAEDPELVVVEVRAEAPSEALAEAAVEHLSLKLPQTWIGRHLHSWDVAQDPCQQSAFWARCLAWGNRAEIVSELEWWVEAYALPGTAELSLRGPDR